MRIWAIVLGHSTASNALIVHEFPVLYNEHVYDPETKPFYIFDIRTKCMH